MVALDERERERSDLRFWWFWVLVVAAMMVVHGLWRFCGVFFFFPLN